MPYIHMKLDEIKVSILKAVKKNTGFDIHFYDIFDWFGFSGCMKDVRESMVNFLVKCVLNTAHIKIELRYICSKKLETPLFSNSGFKNLCLVYEYPNKKDIVEFVSEVL